MNAETAATLILATLLLSAASIAEDSAFVVGSAYDRDSGQLLYSEHYYCEPSSTQCIVRYRDTGGDIIARKDLDYRQSTISPALVMTDFRQDTEVRIPFTGGGNLVVDAGFDNFVREQWDRLEAGKSVTFRFQGVGFDSPLDMKIGATADSRCDTGKLCLEVNIDSWLLSSFIAPIELHYSRADRTLQQYGGISNLKGERGESMDVDIFYEYRGSALMTNPDDGVVYNF